MKISGRSAIKFAAVLSAGLCLGAVWRLPCYAADQTYQQFKILVDVFDLIKENHVEDIPSDKLIRGAAQGMVGQLDPFSQFMDSDTHKRVKSDTEGEFGGLGIRIGVRDGFISVITPLPGTPAYKICIQPGDKIIEIEDVSTKDMSPDDAVKKLRGTPGTKVKITVERDIENKDLTAGWTTYSFTITREIIKTDIIKYRMLDNKIGYLKLMEFTGHAAEDTLSALNSLKKDGMEALVLDLRNNPGGLLSASVDISKYFINSSRMIVYTKGRKPENYQEFRSNSKALFENLPIAVLVNGGSASASEILSGALKDNKRAVIIGSKTFGKASVQSVIPLSDGSGLRLTVAKYYTPSGKLIQHTDKGEGGIAPDIDIKVSRETEVKLWNQLNEVFYPCKPAAAPKKDDKQEPPVRDEVFERAVELLKAREALGNIIVK